MLYSLRERATIYRHLQRNKREMISVSRLTPPPYTLKHNGLVEQRHRHTVETDLALLSHVSIPTKPV